MSFLWIPFLIVVGWFLWAFNRLVRFRNQQAEAWSGVDVQLKKRSDLIPALVECVSTYRQHETETFQKAAAIRTQSSIVQEMRELIALAERYPELKASENFQKLADQLVKIEDDLQYARRYFNGTVRDFRNFSESFPSNIVAKLFGFHPGDFFEVESVLERNNPEWKL